MSDKPMANTTHVLFDLDGLLIDTETCYTVANNALAEKYDKEFTWELKSRCMGLSPRESVALIIREMDLPLNVDQCLQEIDQYFMVALKQVELMPGAERLVRHLYAHKIPMAIATGSDTDSYTKKIAKFDDFFNKSNYFTHYVLAGDDPNVKRGKPFPDVFIECMNRFDPKPEPHNCLVFEDSLAGVKAALAANMPCVWVPDPRNDVSKESATLIVKSLQDFKPELFGLPSFDS